MEETSALARPYALAAFEQAKAEGAISEWGDALSQLSAVVSDRSVAGLIADPRVGNDKLSGLVLDLCEGQLTPTRANFVKLLVENDRLAIAPAIASLFAKAQADAQGVANVEVISAKPVDASYEEKLRAAMAKRLGREVNITVEIDESLIGGAVIRTGDVVIDGSLRGRLRQLETQIA